MKKYLQILKKCPLFHGIAEDNLLRMLTCLGARVTEFDKKYTPLDEKLVKKFDYVPSVRSLRQDTAYELMPWARQCLSTGGEVYARLLEKPTKVFSRWNYDSYMYGVEGDYICYPNEDEKDIYIVKKEVFEETYEAV